MRFYYITYSDRVAGSRRPLGGIVKLLQMKTSKIALLST